MKELSDIIRPLSRFLLIICLIMTALMINKALIGSDDLHHVSQDLLNTFEAPVDQINKFKQLHRQTAHEVIAEHVPLTNYLYKKYNLILGGRTVHYEGLESPFYFSNRDDRPKSYQTYPFAILKFNNALVKESVNFYKTEYDRTAYISYPDYDYFLSHLEGEFRKNVRSGAYHNINVTYEKETSVTDILKMRMDTLKTVSVVCNISSYPDYFSSALNEQLISNHRFVLNVPYKHFPISGTSLKDFEAFREQEGVKYNSDHKAVLRKLDRYAGEISKYGGQNLFMMVADTSPENNLNNGLSIGPVTINVKAFLYAFPVLVCLVMFAIFLLTRSALQRSGKMRGKELIDAITQLSASYYPVNPPAETTTNTGYLRLYYISILLIMLVTTIFSSLKSLSWHFYLGYAIFLAIYISLVLGTSLLLNKMISRLNSSAIANAG